MKLTMTSIELVFLTQYSNKKTNFRRSKVDSRRFKLDQKLEIAGFWHTSIKMSKNVWNKSFEGVNLGKNISPNKDFNQPIG